MPDKILYAKCSNDRAPQFRIMTQIVESGGKKIVRKSATDDAAKAHVSAMVLHEKAMAKMFSGSKFVANKIISADDNSIDFEYVEGQSYDGCLDERLKENDFDGLRRGVRDFFGEIDKIATAEFKQTEQSSAVFGADVFEEGEKSIPVGNIDLIFQNVVVCGSDWNVIDYEWTFDFAVPARFLKWRALFNYLSPEWRRALGAQDALCSEFSFGDKEKEFERLEIEKFRAYVNDGVFFKYAQETKKEVINPFVELANKSAHIEQLIEGERRRDETIRGQAAAIERQDATIKQQVDTIRRQEETIGQQANTINRQKGEREAIVNSFSWKITKPLRLAQAAAHFVLKKLRG